MNMRIPKKTSSLLFAIVLGLTISVIAQPRNMQVDYTYKREINVAPSDKYLNVPIHGWSSSHDYQNVLVRVSHQNESIVEFTADLANYDPDWWAFYPIESFQGKTVTIETTSMAEKEAIDMIYTSSEIPESSDMYSERYRQQVHFSPRRGWNNDPNGLIYYNNEWHLFYQHNPFGWPWGNMHWGHAVSKDLVHWEELPVAIGRPNFRHSAFSGGALVDPENRAGFRRNGIDPLIATYTRTGSGEHIALSYDNGLTFEEYEGNPVLEHSGRDPKVFWYEPGQHWVMIVYHTSQTRAITDTENVMLHQLSIFNSDDMINWEYQSGISDLFECPEIFELPVVGGNGEKKWVMYDAYGKYIVGTFDGKSFTVEQKLKRFEYGDSFYASQTFSNVPNSDGRRIQIGWNRAETPYMPFNQGMAFPTELTLKLKDGQYILTPKPVAEISKLHDKSFEMSNQVLGDTTIALPMKGEQLHIIAEFDKGAAVQFGLNINGYELSYDLLKHSFYTGKAVDHTTRGQNLIGPNEEFFPTDANLKIEVIVDRMSLEVFVNDGELYYVIAHNSVDADKNLELFARGRGQTKLLVKNLQVHSLRSIWPN